MNNIDLITSQTPGRKRQMIFAPEINPRSFLFFFEKGQTGYSYSIRDYSTEHHVRERYAREFGCSADEMRRKAVHLYDAPYMDTKLLAAWFTYTAALNEEFGIVPRDASASDQQPPTAPMRYPEVDLDRYPLLNAETLAQLPKWKKTTDMRRMLQSPRSEDWVTWNMLQLLVRCLPDLWWKHLSACVAAANPAAVLQMGSETPQVSFWRSVPSPVAYERASRERMSCSDELFLRRRSRDPKPVEGNSEIDVVFESNALLIYVEAKVDSDISLRTTYDSGRNQIARNIDCALENAATRTPFFWMFVRNAGAGHMYVDLLGSYRRRPELLCRELPHRDPEAVRRLLELSAIMTWESIGSTFCEPGVNDEPLLASVKAELRRRIG
jgi:hypothetical protein